MSAAFIVIAPGLSTTLQDAGRYGAQRFGIPVSGALDRVSLAAANALVGNAWSTPALEALISGPTLEVDCDSARVAFVGGPTPLEVAHADSHGAHQPYRPLAPLQSIRLKRGDRLRIGAMRDVTAGYLAVAGGFDVALALGSASTYVRAGLGGFAGRAIAAGDRLPLKAATAEDRPEQVIPALDLAAAKLVRVILGPQDDMFTADAIATLGKSTYRVAPNSDRMGLRLEGPRLAHVKGADIASDGTAPGTLQVPGDGHPIVLMSDRQTTGGYAKIATVISADLPALGRIRPGSEIRFEIVSLETAEAAAREHANFLASIPGLVKPLGASPAETAAALAEANLISGIVHAHHDEAD